MGGVGRQHRLALALGRLVTAKMTANQPTVGGRWRTSPDRLSSPSIVDRRSQTSADAWPAVFKTVCGALLRRPGWVRFPSIPAKSRLDDSQDDSHSGECRHALRTAADDSPVKVRTAPNIAGDRTGLTRRRRAAYGCFRHHPHPALMAPIQ